MHVVQQEDGRAWPYILTTGVVIAAKTLRHLPCLQQFDFGCGLFYSQPKHELQTVGANLPFISASLTSLTLEDVCLQFQPQAVSLFGDLPRLRKLSVSTDDLPVSSNSNLLVAPTDGHVEAPDRIPV